MSNNTESLQTKAQLVLREERGVAVVSLTPKQVLSLYRKSEQSSIPFDILEEVYRRGYSEQLSEQDGFNRVNSFISDGLARKLDEDLSKACWKGYEAIGTKKKNGKEVPNCVPVKENHLLNKKTLSAAELAKKHNIPLEKVNKQIVVGKGVEQEHTTSKKAAAEIARDHLGERPDYYMLLNKMEKSKKVKEEYTGTEQVSSDPDQPSNRFVGTTSLVQNYMNSTPGQSVASVIKKVVREGIISKKK